MKPIVSVVMLVFNGELYIKTAIESILNQSFEDFELLIINDGSTDKSIDIVKEFKDSRIRLIDNEGNKGLAYSRNRGMSEAKGEFIAIMDCDDISLNSRLEKQYNYLQNNKDCALVGSLVQSIDSAGNSIGKKWGVLAPSEKIEAIMLFRNVIPNPSVMIRKKVMNEFNYENEYPPSEDYALWLKIIRKYKVWIFPETLLLYRVHNSNISKLNEKKRIDAERTLLRLQLEQFTHNISEEELDLHHSLYIQGKRLSKKQIILTEAWLKRLEQANNSNKMYHHQYFLEVLAEEYYIMCKDHGTHLGIWIIWKFYQNPYYKFLKIAFGKKIRFLAKASYFQIKWW